MAEHDVPSRISTYSCYASHRSLTLRGPPETWQHAIILEGHNPVFPLLFAIMSSKRRVYAEADV